MHYLHLWVTRHQPKRFNGLWAPDQWHSNNPIPRWHSQKLTAAQENRWTLLESPGGCASWDLGGSTSFGWPTFRASGKQLSVRWGQFQPLIYTNLARISKQNPQSWWKYIHTSIIYNDMYEYLWLYIYIHNYTYINWCKYRRYLSLVIWRSDLARYIIPGKKFHAI